MHRYNLNQWQNNHHFHIDATHGEIGRHRVIFLTLAMISIEIGTGMVFGSMTLMAGGWHMGTHAVALGITAFTYAHARRNKDNPSDSFGTGKAGVPSGFTRAVVLVVCGAGNSI